MTQDPGLTHVDETGAARMVDVSAKDVTVRDGPLPAARFSSRPRWSTALRGDGVPKGDALGVARIAGIMGAKRTPDLVPLCHPIAITGVKVDLEVADDAVLIQAQVKTTDRTGVEMEALTAVAVAGLAVIDMVKAIDPAAVLSDVRVELKEGGRPATGSGRESPRGQCLEPRGCGRLHRHHRSTDRRTPDVVGLRGVRPAGRAGRSARR